MQNTTTKARPFNNDLMPHFATFRARLQAVRERQTGAVTSAAPALESTPPHPTQLDAAQAQQAMESVQQEARNGSSIAAAHSGLDPQRVARLLGLLE
ncbi:MAG: pseudouridine synthase [Desulfovibrionaceae bacterium]|nr:pseudouridine synthase [Desulfovibrionaceae bacterium]